MDNTKKTLELTDRELMHLQIIIDMRIIECCEAMNISEDEWTKHEHEKQRFYAEEIKRAIIKAWGKDEKETERV